MTKNQNLGKSLLRDHKKKSIRVKDGYRHTSDLPDGLDWARLNLRSITEQNSVDDFLGKAELAESDYNKEFGNIKIISPDENALPSQEEKRLASAAQDSNKQFLCVPRRPEWSASTTKEGLDALEKTEFLNWRRNLAKVSEEDYINLTPYEKNLEVWRQLWRVIERSDVVVQIIDCRNPLLFRCEDLEKYVKEVGPKHNVLLLNKADFLSEEQREFWAQYFQEIGVKVIFFSALQQNQKLTEIAESEEDENPSEDEEDSSGDDIGDSAELTSETSSKADEKHSNQNIQINEVDTQNKTITNKSNKSSEENDDVTKGSCSLPTSDVDKTYDHNYELLKSNSSTIYSREELIDYFKQFKSLNLSSNFITVGLVGYPNVGKSSTLNALIQNKKVQVSSTPGKTKHFQTFMIDTNLCLCDCPGLVFPNFVSSKAEMVINGILSIDHLTDHIFPMRLIADLIPKHVLEATYSIIIPFQDEKNPNKITAEDFLNAYGYMRGFVTQRGIPDNARSSRYILKDFVNGRILYCHAPPFTDDIEYQKYTIRSIKQHYSAKTENPKLSKLAETSNVVDKNFFQKVRGEAHVKGATSQIKSKIASTSETNKPYKKHHNKNKKEKLRRVYRDNDY